MTARKPRKAAPRKASKAPTIEQRIKAIEEWANELVVQQGIAYSNIRDERDELVRRIDALETRGHFRDASHDEPVSNDGEAVGQHFRIVGEVRGWRRPLRALVRWMDSP